STGGNMTYRLMCARCCPPRLRMSHFESALPCKLSMGYPRLAGGGAVAISARQEARRQRDRLSVQRVAECTRDFEKIVRVRRQPHDIDSRRPDPAQVR